jgi:hypothetical protein
MFQAAELRSPVHYPIKRDYTFHDFARGVLLNQRWLTQGTI